MTHSYFAQTETPLNDLSGSDLIRPTVWVATAVFVLILLAHVQKISQIELFLNLNGASVQLISSNFWPAITLFGDTLILLCWMSPLLLLRGRIVLSMVAAIPMGGLASVGFKRLFSAPRPGDVLQHDSFHVLGEILSGHSFPSGHSITAFAAAAVVYACLVPERKQTKVAGVIGGAFVLAILVGLSRVAVGAHWPSDVVAGACIGWLSGLNGVWLTRKFPITFGSPRFSWVTLWVLVACGVGLQLRHHMDPTSQVITLLAATMVSLTLMAKALGSRQFRLDGQA